MKVDPYYVRREHTTPEEPLPGWYWCDDREPQEPVGPYFSVEEARASYARSLREEPDSMD